MAYVCRHITFECVISGRNASDERIAVATTCESVRIAEFEEKVKFWSPVVERLCIGSPHILFVCRLIA